MLAPKANLRIVVADFSRQAHAIAWNYRSILGAMLAQERERL